MLFVCSCVIIEPWFKNLFWGFSLCCLFVFALFLVRLPCLCRFGLACLLCFCFVLFGLSVGLFVLSCSSVSVVLLVALLVAALFGVPAVRWVCPAVGVAFLLARLLVFVVPALFGLFVLPSFVVVRVLSVSFGCGFLLHPKLFFFFALRAVAT